jgi:hypothetical protein
MHNGGLEAYQENDERLNCDGKRQGWHVDDMVMSTLPPGKEARKRYYRMEKGKWKRLSVQVTAGCFNLTTRSNVSPGAKIRHQ